MQFDFWKKGLYSRQGMGQRGMKREKWRNRKEL